VYDPIQSKHKEISRRIRPCPGALSLFTTQEFRRTPSVRPRSKGNPGLSNKQAKAIAAPAHVSRAAPVRAPARLYSERGKKRHGLCNTPGRARLTLRFRP